MHPSRSASRGRLAATSAVALACGAATLLPAPAQASTLIGQVYAAAGSNSAGGTCSGTGEDSQQASITSSGTKSRSVSVNGTVTDSSDAADTSTWSASSKMTVTSQTSGSPSMVASGKLAAAVNAAQGDASDCNVTAQSAMEGIGFLNLDVSGWINMSVSHPAATTAVVAITDMSTMQVIYEGLDQETYSSTVWVGSGQYQVAIIAQANADDDSTTPTVPKSVSGTVTARIAYSSTGAAKATQSGTGASYLKLGNGVNCTDHQVLGIFSRKAKGLRSATFTVNGKKQRTIKSPSPGSAVVLKTGSSTSDASVKVALVTKQGKKLSTSRSYLACE